MGSNLPRCDIQVDNLGPGIWTHDITVSATGQEQYRQSLLVSDPAKRNNIEPDATRTYDWTVFKTVLTVNQYAAPDCGNPPVQCDHTNYTCSDGTCMLRDAIAEGKTKPQPVLIQFDPSVFPASLAPLSSPPANEMPIIQTAGDYDQGVDLNAANMVIDGTDPHGNPSELDLPEQRIYSRWVRIHLANNEDRRWNGTLKISAANVSLAGLHIQRDVPASGGSGKDQDVIDFYAPATTSSVVRCQIDGGAGDKTGSSTGRDCIEAQGGGSGGTATDFSQANVVQHTEISHCWDKGIKVSGTATGSPFLRVEDSWVHDTIDTGVQATLSGQLRIKRSLVERSGYHTGTPTPVNVSANGIAANGAYMPPTPTPGYIPTPAVLISEGNISRTNPQRNFFARFLSTVTLTNDFSCGAATNGILVGDAGETAGATVSLNGAASVYSGSSGLYVQGLSTIAPSPANNAFTKNKSTSTSKNVYNSRTQSIALPQTQWEHCGTGSSCVLGNIQTLDTNGSTKVNVSSPQAQRNPGSPSISAVFPLKVAKVGAVVRITGSGFNAIDGATATAGSTSSCGTLGSGKHVRPGQRHVRGVPQPDNGSVGGGTGCAGRHADAPGGEITDCLHAAGVDSGETTHGYWG